MSFSERNGAEMAPHQRDRLEQRVPLPESRGG